MNSKDLVREIRAINDERVDNLLRCGYIEGIMNAYSFKALGGTNVFKEDNMNERMTRKELTAKVRELERELGRRLFDIKDLRQRLNLQLAKIEDLEDDRVSFKRFQALIEFLGLESQYVCGTEGRYEFSKKKVRKPYTRK